MLGGRSRFEIDVRQRIRRRPGDTAPAGWHDAPLAALATTLGVGDAGLSGTEAARRLAAYGANVVQREHRGSLVRAFAGRLRNPLVVLLVAASLVTATAGDLASCLTILVIVALSVTLDCVQEYRANEAAAALRRSVALTARVVRDGAVVTRSADALVPGDVVVLGSGDLVPADGRVLEARDFFVDQAFLTGESYPVEKHAAVAPATDWPAHVLWLGTAVVSGTARMLIVATGAETRLAELGASLDAPEPPGAFERGITEFGLLLMRLTLLLVLFVVLVNAVFARPLLESFLFATALAVGLTPELLPMVVSVTLARGALRMASRQVIVKRLAAVQNLGAIDVLCTDKTGTLTEGRIRLERHCGIDGHDRERVLLLACLNSRFETGLRSPLDEAILAHEEIDTRDWRKIDEVPFDFTRRRVSVLLEHGDEQHLIVKGAPEDVLAVCAAYEAADGRTPPFDASSRERAHALYDALSRDGFRVLAIASRRVPAACAHAMVDDESGLVFAGYAAFLDPPKATAGAALQALAARGIRILIVTGDNEAVTQNLCAQIGYRVRGVLTGAELARLTDAALAARIGGCDVFCRMPPEQKARLLAALQRRGHTVGFLGDGMNDAPSLHAADVGISVANAVDVAKAAADLILLEQDLHALACGVDEGRRAHANVMKYIMMATSSNFGNMFSMAAAALVVPFLPLLPLQVLLNNLLYDVSELALPFDRIDEEVAAQPCVWDMGSIRRAMLTLGPVSSLFDFATFGVLLLVFHAGAAEFRTAWFLESLATQVLVIFVIRTRRRPWASLPHPLLPAFALGVLGVAFMLPLMPAAARLGFTPLPTGLLCALAAIVTVYLVAAETAKRALYAPAFSTSSSNSAR